MKRMHRQEMENHHASKSKRVDTDDNGFEDKHVKICRSIRIHMHWEIFCMDIVSWYFLVRYDSYVIYR
jgi:hypothetical protein